MEAQDIEAVKFLNKKNGPDSNYIPMIIYIQEDSINVKKLKFLTQKDHSFSNVMGVIRKKINMGSDKAIFLFDNTNLFVSPNNTVGDIYNKHGDKENKCIFLRLKLESAFGN